MDIEDAPGEVIDEHGCQDSHETCEDNEVRRVSVQRVVERGIERLAVRIVAVLDTFDGNARSLRTLESVRCGFVAQHN